MAPHKQPPVNIGQISFAGATAPWVDEQRGMLPGQCMSFPGCAGLSCLQWSARRVKSTMTSGYDEVLVDPLDHQYHDKAMQDGIF